jgi:hypothetical protein
MLSACRGLLMEFPPELEAVEGAKNLRDWFGYWPSFHDGEVIEMHLCRSSVSSIKIHTWETTNEVDAHGYNIMTKHVVVEFLFKGISSLSLSGFNNQNVLFGLALEKANGGYRLILDECYGLAGTIEANEISIRLAPGKPQDAHF